MVGASLLGAAEIRDLARSLGIRPTKVWGQNFVHDANTVRAIARRAGVGPSDHVLEIGPGLGSLTLALLERAAAVTAVEIDPILADALSETVRRHLPERVADLRVLHDDALRVSALDPLSGVEPGVLVANLPYNIAVPVLLTMLERFDSLRSGLVLVQAEVADRLAAPPGSRTYGAPSAKAAWYADVHRSVTVSRQVFWPVPGVDSALAAFTRRDPPDTPAPRASVFAVIDAAFAQRRKTLRAALAGWAGSAARAEVVLRRAGIDPATRGEQLDVRAFAAIAASADSL